MALSADAVELSEDRRQPLEDVVLGDMLLQPDHAMGPLLRRHFDGLLQSIRYTLHVIGIDQQRVVELLSGAGELAADQHPFALDLRSDKFFRHQVHTIVQGAHHGKVRQAVIDDELRWFQVLIAIMNGLVSIRPEAAVETLDQAFDLLFDLAVFIDLGPARDGNLHETEAALILRIFFEEAFDGLKPADDPFSIIQPIDPEPNDREGQLRFRTELRQAPGHPALAGEAGPPVIVDADWKRAHPGLSSFVLDDAGFQVHIGPQHAFGALQKVLAVLVKVESKQIVAEQPFQEFPAPGTDAVEFPGGPGNMPEVHDEEVRQATPQVLRT